MLRLCPGAACSASTGVQAAEAAFKNYTIVNNTYTDPKYLVTIVAGSPPAGLPNGSACVWRTFPTGAPYINYICA